MPLTVSDYETGVQPPGGGSNYLNSYYTYMVSYLPNISGGLDLEHFINDTCSRGWEYVQTVILPYQGGTWFFWAVFRKPQ
jgi:hypothetical protein